VIQDNVFGADVRNAVIAFQRRFNLTPDGVVGPATWNRLYQAYRDTKNIEVPPQPEPPGPGPSPTPQYPGTPLRVGSTGENVRLIQSYLAAIHRTYPSIPAPTVDGIFGPRTEAAVIAFQRQFLLTPDGIVGPVTWNELVRQYSIAIGNPHLSPPFPGTALRVGSRGDGVRIMQQYLRDLRGKFPSLPAISVDGVFGPQTQAAVIAFQRLFNLTPDGVIGPLTWTAIINQRSML
jgi:peptidoglycan hydrolase-like protein with peptidoglycan-binding domain